jgi:UDP-glucose 4-epimerase
MNIAITGISGYLGQLIFLRLDKEKSVKTIIGMDISQPKSTSDKLKFFTTDIRDTRIANILKENSTNVVVHLAFIMAVSRNPEKARDIDVNGTKNVLDACEKANVRKVVTASSTVVYGAHPDNPDWLTEDSPLRGNPDYFYCADKIEMERLCLKHAQEHPETAVTILRPCDVYGPGANFPLSRALEMKKVYLFEGFDPEYQFIHEEDLAEAFWLAIRKDVDGIFNVTSDGTTSLSECAKLTGKEVSWVRLTRMTSTVLRIMWALHLMEASPPSFDFWKYRWTASNEKIKRELGFHPQYTSREAFMSKYK